MSTYYAYQITDGFKSEILKVKTFSSAKAKALKTFKESHQNDIKIFYAELRGDQIIRKCLIAERFNIPSRRGFWMDNRHPAFQDLDGERLLYDVVEWPSREITY